MAKLSKEFFTDGEVLFVGYSSRNKAFSRAIYDAFMRGGIKVFPFNHKAGGSYDVKVYQSLSELPKVPRSAFVLLNRENAGKIIHSLADSGVRRILFQSAKNVDAGILEECKKLGMETMVACPMMVFGSGIHKIHGFFAGVR